MTPRAALLQIGKLVAQDIAKGYLSEGTRAVSGLFETYPSLCIDLLDQMVRENVKKKPNTKLITAFSYMLGQALEVLRFGVERSRPEAKEIVAAIEQRLLTLGNTGALDPALLLMILTQYSVAKLAPGDDLRSLMGGFVEQAAEHGIGMPAAPQASDHFGQLVKQTGGDVYAIFAELVETSHAFPPDHRAAMAYSVLQSELAPVREAGIGWLLDESEAVRNIVANAVSQMAGGDAISATMLRRLITLRNWLPEVNRSAVDGAIKTCRQKSIACAPLSMPQVRDIAASGIDGAGAQSLFVMVKEGRKHAVGSLLVKHGVGIADAWVHHGLSQREAEGFLNRVEMEIDLFESSLDHLGTTLAHFLAVNLTCNRMPPFGLVDFIESVGLSAVNPSALPLDTLLVTLTDKIPAARKRPALINKAVKASALWAEDYGFVEHWFEDDDEVHQLLDGKRLSEKRRVDLILDSLLPGRSQRWAELLAWSALMLHEEDLNEDWSDFALVAGEIHGGRPLREIPVMYRVALATVEAWQARDE